MFNYEPPIISHYFKYIGSGQNCGKPGWSRMVILFFLALIINISIMLEKNFLYRRMQNRDIFRTFSRTYSRQHHQRSQRNNPHNSTTDQL